MFLTKELTCNAVNKWLFVQACESSMRQVGDKHCLGEVHSSDTQQFQSVHHQTKRCCYAIVHTNSKWRLNWTSPGFVLHSTLSTDFMPQEH